MAVFVQDSFTDSDFTLLQNHSPDTGGAWQPLGIGTPDTANCVTIDNTLQSASGGDSAQVYRNAADPGAGEYDIVATWTVADATNEFRTWGLYARMTPTGTGNANVDRYQVQYIGASATGDRDLVLQKVVAGTTTTLDILEGINYQGQTITVRLEIRDAVKRVLVDDSEALSSADNDITQAGRAGVSAPANGSGNFTDDFSADTVSAATDLDGTEATQAQTATAAALTQTHELAADGTTQAQTATAATLTQTHELAAESATQAQAATAAALTQVHELQPTSAMQGQAATATALAQTHELAATDAVQAQTADTVAVAQGVTLSPASTVQVQVAATAALTQVHELSPADVLQAQTADAVTLAGDVLINLDFVALAPVFAHGSPTAPEFRQRFATIPESGHGAAGEPEFAARAAGDPAFAHGDSAPLKFKSRTALAPAFAHGDPGEPTT